MTYLFEGEVKGSSQTPSLSLPALFCITFGVALAICLFDLGDARTFLGDIDDQLREVQIRHLLFGGGTWWDLGLPMVASPAPYQSPWSRLVDLPYVGVTILLAPLLGKEHALLLAFETWPPTMLAMFCLLTALIFRRFGLPSTVLGCLTAVTAIILMVFGVWEFVPGRIDHHNAQLLALLTMVYGLSRWDVWGGRLIGFGAVVSITIALEGLPFVVVIFAGLVVVLVFKVANAAKVVKHAAAVMVVLSLPMGFAMLGPVGLFSTQCDAYSAPYIFLVTGFGAILWGVSAFVPAGRPLLQCVALGVPSIALLSIFAALFTSCLDGPYWMIDPVSKTYWFNRISQEHSALYFIEHRQVAIALLLVVLGSILTVATVAIVSDQRPNLNGLPIILALAWASLVLTLLLNRYIRFAFAFAPLFLPVALAYCTVPLTKAWSRRWRIIAVAFCAVYFAIALCLIIVTPAKAPLYDAVDYMAYDECENGDFSVLGTVRPGRLMTPLGLSLPILEKLPSGFSVAAISFHRASPGMKRVFEAFVSAVPAVRRNALAPFDYVAICRFPLKADYGTAPLYDALAAGKDWPGLIRLPTGANNPFQLFRINHAALQ